MRFTVNQSSLSKALSIVSKGISTHSTLPVLGGIYIKASQGTLELQTTDLDTSIRHKITANVEEEGTTVISGRIIQNVIKNLDDSTINFDGGDGVINITCKKSSYHLKTLNPSEFPNFPEIAWERSVELPCNTLSKMVDKVHRVTSRDTSRPILSGILLNVEENLIRLVATDSYRLAVCDTNIETSSLTEPFQLIIPGDVFYAATSLFEDTNTVLIGNNDNQVIFVSGNTTYVSRRINGNFPNFRQLVPSSCSTSVKMKVEDLAGALKRVSSITAANSSIKLDVEATDAQVVLTSTSADQGDAREIISTKVEGQDNSICLNYRYIGDCISALDNSEEITLELNDYMKPGIFKAYSKINYLYILMPVRM